MADNQPNRCIELMSSLRQSLRKTLEAILRGGIYRNAGEIPHYEHPIKDLMDILGFENCSQEQIEHLVAIILAIFDNQDYPGQGTQPEIEAHIYQSCAILNQAFQENFNCVLSLYPWYNHAEN